MSNPKTRVENPFAKPDHQSAFDERGRLKESFQGDPSVSMGEYLHLGSIPWPPAPNGSDHAEHLTRLVEYIAREIGPKYGGLDGMPFDVHTQKVLHAVGMLYAVGKGSMGEPGQEPLGVEGYEARSASYAERYFRDGGGVGTYWSKDVVREDVCRLILRHNDEREIKLDKRLQVFADARRYELARIDPNGTDGKSLAMLKREWVREKFYLGWSQDDANRRTYMITRGWK